MHPTESLLNKLTVTKPTLPSLDEYIVCLREIWDNRFLTNMGPFHERFEAALSEYLGVPYLSVFCNGTMALQIGLQAMGITGEVITTPFTFPATVHAIYWNRCTPVFCDIDLETLGISADGIEQLISSKTTAVLPVHVYGKPCDTKAIQSVADLHGLKVFYDAAHAFGVFEREGDDECWGDLSMLSFHATKIFNTMEGGALVMKDAEMKERIDSLKNFGIVDDTTIVGQGINGKMTEIIAAFGLLQLKEVDRKIDHRAKLDARYRENLNSISGISLFKQSEGYRSNYCYFPIFVKDEFGITRDELDLYLRNYNILCRRYFYPLVSDAPCYRHLPSADPKNLPVATKVSNEVLCLPLYSGLTIDQIDMICDRINKSRLS